MIIHQPYRSLTALQGIFSLSQEESALAWSVVNDHYMTDLPLLYPPHTIAIMAIILALVLRPNPTGIQSTSSTTSSIATAYTALTSAVQASKAGGVGEKTNPGSRTKVQRLISWLAESEIDIEAVVDCTQELISFYEAQELYNEKHTREQINRYVKARGLDK